MRAFTCTCQNVCERSIRSFEWELLGAKETVILLEDLDSHVGGCLKDFLHFQHFLRDFHFHSESFPCLESFPFWESFPLLGKFHFHSERFPLLESFPFWESFSFSFSERVFQFGLERFWQVVGLMILHACLASLASGGSKNAVMFEKCIVPFVTTRSKPTFWTTYVFH